MSSASARFTIIEWMVVAVVTLLVARLIWAHEFLAAEEQFFAILGLGGEKRFLVAVPLAALWGYRIYARERIRAHAAGVPVVRPKVIVASIVLLLLAGVVLAYAVLG